MNVRGREENWIVSLYGVSLIDELFLTLPQEPKWLLPALYTEAQRPTTATLISQSTIHLAQAGELDCMKGILASSCLIAIYVSDMVIGMSIKRTRETWRLMQLCYSTHQLLLQAHERSFSILVMISSPSAGIQRDFSNMGLLVSS